MLSKAKGKKNQPSWKSNRSRAKCNYLYHSSAKK